MKTCTNCDQILTSINPGTYCADALLCRKCVLATDHERKLPAIDAHGLTEGMRVIADGEDEIEGVISSIDADAGIAWVQWDNGNLRSASTDELVPVDGW